MTYTVGRQGVPEERESLHDPMRLPERTAFAAIDGWSRRRHPTLFAFLRSREGPAAATRAAPRRCHPPESAQDTERSASGSDFVRRIRSRLSAFT